MITDNVKKVWSKIERAAERSGRNPKDITLVCVVKNRSLGEIKEAVKCGITDIGENRVQEAKSKYQNSKLRTQNSELVKWHLVGHLQTNKARHAVKIFDLIHSLDSLKLANEINAQAAKINKVQDVLVEVNTSGETTKFGIKPAELLGLVKGIINLKNIKLLGLMTIAPIVEDKENARPYFRNLRQLQSELNNFLSTINYPSVPSPLCAVVPRDEGRPLTILSMGMTQDYEVAIEEGATIVRIGTAIFKDTNVQGVGRDSKG